MIGTKVAVFLDWLPLVVVLEPQDETVMSTSQLVAASIRHLREFWTLLATSCDNLHAIVQRKPDSESPDDNFESFLEDLNTDVSCAMADLQQLESLTTDTLAFEELLGHCTAVYEQNETGISALELQLQQYGYTPVADISNENIQAREEVLTHEARHIDALLSDEAASPARPASIGPSYNESPVITPIHAVSKSKNVQKDPEYSPLIDSLSLEALGISATSLTALAHQDCTGDFSGDGPGEGAEFMHSLPQNLFVESQVEEGASNDLRNVKVDSSMKIKYNFAWTNGDENMSPAMPSQPSIPMFSANPATESLVAFNNSYPVSSLQTSTESSKEGNIVSRETRKVASLDLINSEQFNKSPSWLKLQISLEELNVAVVSINKILLAKETSAAEGERGPTVLNQEDINLLGLGTKAKAGLLLLVKLNKLVTQFSNGVTFYRVCV